MPAHRALECYDILQLIFDHFLLPDDADVVAARACRRTLASAARVCQAFSDPALNSLWETLDDLLHVLNVLPCVELQQAPQDDVDIYVLTAEVEPADWERFQQYAKRIRRVAFTVATSVASPWSILLHLTHLNNHQPLFPRLRHLAWTQSAPFDYSLLYLVSPSLLYLSFAINGMWPSIDQGQDLEKEHAITHLFRAVCSKSPSLRHISTKGLGILQAGQAFAMCRELRSLDIDPAFIDVPLLHALSSLPNLVRLDISSYVYSGEESHLNRFPVLQELTIRGSVMLAVQVANTVSSLLLHTLSLEITFDDPDLGDSEELAHVLCRLTSVISKRFPIVRCFSANIVAGFRQDSEELAPLVQPLTAMHTLEHIKLRCNKKLVWGDEDFIALAAAWPKAKEVSLLFFAGLEDIETPVLPRVLLEFARLCPNLETLELPVVDFRSHSLPLLEKRPAPHGLRTLYISNVTNRLIQDPFQVARFLDSVFPNLAAHEMATSNLTLVMRMQQEQAGWKQVVKLLTIFQQGRKPNAGHDRTHSEILWKMVRRRSQ
ncbi:hypothetical protein BKA93DRAFT_142945 [Sparassis latifolia]